MKPKRIFTFVYGIIQFDQNEIVCMRTIQWIFMAMKYEDSIDGENLDYYVSSILIQSISTHTTLAKYSSKIFTF